VAIVVRHAILADSAQAAQLISTLGYPTSLTQMAKRLAAILSDEGYATLVACDGEHVVGLIGTRVGPLYESDGHYGQIMALAVASNYQRQGIGRMLLRAAESMLIARGVSILIVTSGVQRTNAHAFYENNGYAFTGRRYTKAT
jgi:ribosomal protein S18 acetylase RimI-like enzyme